MYKWYIVECQEDVKYCTIPSPKVLQTIGGCQELYNTLDEDPKFVKYYALVYCTRPKYFIL